jgi:glutaredoxin 3
MADNPAVVVYSTPFCPYCMRARSLLNRKGVSYQEIDVSGDQVLWQEMEAKSGRATVPQIFIGEQHIGGYDDMARLDYNDALDPLLNLNN